MHVCMYLGCKFNTFYPYVAFLSHRANGFSVFYVGLIGNVEGLEACLLAIIAGIRYLLVLNSVLLPEMRGSDQNTSYYLLKCHTAWQQTSSLS